MRDVYEGHKSLEEKFYYIPVLGSNKIDLDELKDILLENIDRVDDKGAMGTNLRRLFRIYDYLMFGRPKRKTEKVLEVSNT